MVVTEAANHEDAIDYLKINKKRYNEKMDPYPKFDKNQWNLEVAHISRDGDDLGYRKVKVNYTVEHK